MSFCRANKAQDITLNGEFCDLIHGVLRRPAKVFFLPEASFSCVAAIRPESGVKPTWRDRSTDAIGPFSDMATSIDTLSGKP